MEKEKVATTLLRIDVAAVKLVTLPQIEGGVALTPGDQRLKKDPLRPSPGQARIQDSGL